MKNLNLHLGDYKGEPLYVYGGGFEKVNLITGMKGGGKSHITKGIIHQSFKAGMSAVVFDINNEYDQLPGALVLKPSENLKFRLDFMKIESLFHMIERLAPFAEKTAYTAHAKIPQLIKERRKQKNKDDRFCIPDLPFLKQSANKIIEGTNTTEYIKNMRMSYARTFDIIENYNLIMTEADAQKEDTAIKEGKAAPVISLRTAFSSMLAGTPQVLVFQIGGLQSVLQKVIVNLVLDHLKKSCKDQHKAYQDYLENEKTEEGRERNKNKHFAIPIPMYPTVYFEEAHMYMDAQDINDLVPVIRHIGINVFFVTNTPGALPDSVFRLLDNLIMTHMVNRKDIDRVADCGLTDKETIIGFARDLKEHHALFLSGKEGATKNFPLVFHVRNFGLPKSGETRSQWKAMKELKEAQQETISDAGQANTSDSNSP